MINTSKLTVKNVAARMKSLKLPVLILDRVWLEKFPKEYKSAKIIECEVRLKRLMKEYARCSEAHKVIVYKKKECLNKILALSSEAYDNNNLAAKNAMTSLQNTVFDINDEIEQIAKRMEQIPDEITNSNFELLTETVYICYKQLEKSRGKLNKMNRQAEKLRAELNAVIDEKVRHEEMAEKTYSLLHDLIGSELIDKLDDEL